MARAFSILLLVVALAVVVVGTVAFCPPSLARRPPSRLSYASSVTEGEQQQQPRLLILHNDKETTTTTTTTTTPSLLISQPISSSSEEGRGGESQKTTINKRDDDPSPFFRSVTRSIREGWKRCQQSFSSFWIQQQQRPGNQFRFKLGLGVMTAVALGSLLVRPNASSLWTTMRHWLSHRGFQGLAAAGRTVAYAWALLVGYPRLLDKRAAEQERKQRDVAAERQRVHRQMLATEVMRLRTELAALDKEMRTFRRQIITWKANNNNNNNNGTTMMNPDIQEAIAAEMAHLAQLRADTQAALTAVRARWADVRAKSSPELWQNDHHDDDLVLVDAATTIRNM